MSLFYFRLHNLQREDASKRRNVEIHQRRNEKVFHRLSTDDVAHLTAPSRLFEKTPMISSDQDSLDEIAIRIPRSE